MRILKIQYLLCQIAANWTIDMTNTEDFSMSKFENWNFDMTNFESIKVWLLKVIIKVFVSQATVNPDNLILHAYTIRWIGVPSKTIHYLM